MTLTHEVANIQIHESDQLYVLDVIATGGENLLMGLSYSQLLGLAALIATVARRRQNKSCADQAQKSIQIENV